MMKSIPYFSGLDVFDCSMGHSFGDPFDQGWPDLYSVQFLRSGKMLFGMDGMPPAILTAPALYWIEPKHRYYLSGIGGDDIRDYVLFRGKAGKRLMYDGFVHLSDSGHMAVDRAGEMEATFEALRQVVTEHSPTAEAEASLLLHRILLLMASQPHEEPMAARETISEAATILREHATVDHDLPDLARSLGMSYSHFRKCFRDQIGRSPHDFLLHCRAQAAAAMLQSSRRQIKEVALACGYADPAEFSRAFHRQLGVTPTMYRRIVM